MMSSSLYNDNRKQCKKSTTVHYLYTVPVNNVKKVHRYITYGNSKQCKKVRYTGTLYTVNNVKKYGTHVLHSSGTVRTKCNTRKYAWYSTTPRFSDGFVSVSGPDFFQFRESGIPDTHRILVGRYRSALEFRICSGSLRTKITPKN